MIRNFTFALLGLFIGLALFTYGVITQKTNTRSKTVAAVIPKTDPRIDEIQRNIIIDPVEIRNPYSSQTEVNTQAAALSQTASSAATGLNATGNDSTTSLAEDIIPPTPTNEPVLDEGWANAAYLPKDNIDADDSAVEEEVVQ